MYYTVRAPLCNVSFATVFTAKDAGTHLTTPPCLLSQTVLSAPRYTTTKTRNSVNIERSCLPTQAEMDGCKRSGTDEQATIDCWCSDGPGCNSRIIYTPNSLPNSLATRPSTGGLLLLAIGVAFKLHLTLVPVL
ncbi:hypothetical protein MAR_027625 [Mya arenaria]|uniref:Uncharacterized protein n=1 Tax=Mya arenaria TaxID=6604 RepID=A0ABY7ETZ9_MYAAR|nr:hypothetical protein MAR_027625 [Mya arenaria]